VHGPSSAAGPHPVFFGGDDDDDWGRARVNEMRVICQTPGDSEAISESIQAKQLADKRDAGRPKTTPPSGAAGFSFEQTLGKGREACEDAGNSLSDRTCSGVAQDVGVPARAHLGFCSGLVCMIVVEAALPPAQGAAWKRAFMEARRALASCQVRSAYNQESALVRGLS
jgi:hypothetical protein